MDVNPCRNTRIFSYLLPPAPSAPHPSLPLVPILPLSLPIPPHPSLSLTSSLSSPITVFFLAPSSNVGTGGDSGGDASLSLSLLTLILCVLLTLSCCGGATVDQESVVKVRGPPSRRTHCTRSERCWRSNPLSSAMHFNLDPARWPLKAPMAPAASRSQKDPSAADRTTRRPIDAAAHPASTSWGPSRRQRSILRSYRC